MRSRKLINDYTFERDVMLVCLYIAYMDRVERHEIPI